MLHFIQKQTLRFILLLLLIVAGKDGFGQKETWNWYFGALAGLNFSTGIPVPITDGGMHAWAGSSVMSDSAGNLLFYSNGEKVWGRNHAVMPNGDDLFGCVATSQPCVAIPKPGSDYFYYLITVRDFSCNPNNYGAFYNVIDMNLNGGIGDIVPGQKNIPIPNADSVSINVSAIKHANNVDFWIILRSYKIKNYFAAYLLDANGLHSEPVLSDCMNNVIYNPGEPQIKVSPDGKYLCIAGSYGSNNELNHELYTLEAGTGKLKPVFTFSTDYWVSGLEFSANSEYLYITTYYNGFSYFSDTAFLTQYDMAKATSSSAFIASAVKIYREIEGCELDQMQIGPDGKIYVAQWEDVTLGQSCYYLSAINYPSEHGLSCAFEKNAVYLDGRLSLTGLPNFVQSYFSKFDWLGACEGDETIFRSHFLPQPDSMRWDFDDPVSGANNTSTLLNPLHRFSVKGTYQVQVIAYYSNGHHETAIREVKILPYPTINLGPDITVCKGQEVILNAGFGASSYTWNTGSTSNILITTEPGIFSVKVKNQNGCANSDTINVMNYTAAEIDETNLTIAPTTCGKTNGAITGLQVIGQPPFSVQWTASGTPVSDSLDIYHLGTGLYELHVTDGFGCTNTIASYAISDAGNLWIDTAKVTPAYCGNTDGTLTITAISGLGSMLQYFIKTGSDTLSKWGDGNFAGLAGGIYYVWVSDSGGCSKPYAYVLQIDALTAPEILTATSTPETGSAADGTITVNALGIGLTYSLNGATPANTGYFTGLSAGGYSVTVTNPAGCDTTFTVTVAHQTGIVLSAIAGNGFACLGKEAKAPIVVRNFKDVQSFETILNYDPLFVTCLGFNNPHPLFGGSLEVTLPASGKILTRWKGTTPLTLPDSTEIVQLVFSSLLPGNALLLWDISPAISNFLGPGGDTLNVDYTLGTILVSNPPQILPDPKQTDCEGGLLMVWRTVVNGTGPLSYQWQTPAGPSSQEIIIKTATLADNGLYQLIVTDTLQCADTSTKIVTVVPTPVSGFPTNSDTLYFDERRWLEAAQGYDTYSWNTGDTTNSILVTAEGWYKVTIATPEGCTTTDSVMMLYAFVPLTMPNAFTPDGDGLNDVFRPVTLPEKISSFSMYIYDRWGKQVFFTNDVKQGWDGTINGSPAQIGGYVYVVKYGNPSGAVREKRGMVMVVR